MNWFDFLRAINYMGPCGRAYPKKSPFPEYVCEAHEEQSQDINVGGELVETKHKQSCLPGKMELKKALGCINLSRKTGASRRGGGVCSALCRKWTMMDQPN